MNAPESKSAPKRRSLLMRAMRVIGFILFCLVTLFLLLIAEENWRGRRAWDRFRQEWEAKGEKFDLASITPKPVPAEQNFAMTPLLAPLLDYQMVHGAVQWRDSNALARVKNLSLSAGHAGQKMPSLGDWRRAEAVDMAAWQAYLQDKPTAPAGDPEVAARAVLIALQKFDPVVAELRAASQRPYSVFPFHYDENFFAQMDHLSALRGLSQIVVLRALAELRAGQSDAALADARLALRLGQSLRAEPLLISQLVRIAITQSALQPVWEGLARHQWNDTQLVELQQAFSEFHWLEDYGLAMRGERAFSIELMSQYRAGRLPREGEWDADFKPLMHLMPSGWLYQNQLVICRLEQELALPTVDATAHRVFPERCSEAAITKALDHRSPYNIFAWMLLPALGKAAERFAQAQTITDHAGLAFGLERYRLANGKYPETLAALVPTYAEKLPSDVIGGEPLKYRLDNAGQPVIYSIGWNEKDDGGIPVAGGSAARIDDTAGDWVWRYPAK